MIKLRICSDFPVLSLWALNVVINLSLREKTKEDTEQKKDNEVMEADSDSGNLKQKLAANISWKKSDWILA